MRLRRWLYLVTALLAAAAALLTFVTVRAFTTGFPMNATRVTAPGSATITLTEPGTYTLSYEHQVAGDFGVNVEVGSDQPNFPTELAGLEMSIRSADSGDQVPLHSLADTFTYQSGSTEGLGLAGFTVDRPGTYVLDSRFSSAGAGQPVTLAIARGAPGDTFAYVLYGFGVIALLFSTLAVGAVALFLRLRAGYRARLDRTRAAVAASVSKRDQSHLQ